MTATLPAVLTGEGRRRLGGHALAHPVRTILVAYAVSRVAVLVALWVAATWFANPAGVGHLHPTPADLFGTWDGGWYASIVRDGYPVPLPADPVTGRLTYSAWAFYPAFPMLARPLTALGIPFTAAGVVVNLVLGAVAAVLVWRVFRYRRHAEAPPDRDRLALVAAVLWCFYPATTVLLQPYSEALAMTLAAAAILLLMQHRYLATSAVAAVLGLTRGVAPALGVVVVMHLVARWREDRLLRRSPLRGQRLTAVLMVAVTGLSGLVWPTIAGVASGIPTAFFDVQAAWGQRPSEGPFVLWFTWAWNSHGIWSVVVLVALVGTYLALVLGRHGRWLPVEVRAWAVAYPLYMFAVVRPITSMWRFLLLDFPIAALVTSVAMRTSTGARIVPHWRRRVGVVMLLLVVGLVWWTCALWTVTPWGSRPP